jgi:hypothetical protein
MMITIKCPKCDADTKVSFINASYHGPHKCWKCREFYTLTVENNCVRSLEPLSQEEYAKRQAMLDKQKELEKQKNVF